MRLHLGEKVHFEVMSSSDSSLHATVSSTATHNTESTSSTDKPSETSDEGNVNSSVQRASLGILSSSSSDIEGQDSSLHLVSSNSEVNEQSLLLQQQHLSSFDASAYDEEGLDPSKKDNAKSAFAITSVRPSSDDHDRSAIRHPVSTDSLRETLIEAKTGSIVTPEKQPSLPSTKLDDSDVPAAQAHFQIGSPKEDEDQPTGVVEEVATPSTTNITQSQGATTFQEDSAIPAYPSNAISSVGGSGGGASGGATAVNGTSVQPNRFRRVNQYERGRWTVRDSFVTEEQAETTLASGDNSGSFVSTPSTKHMVNSVKELDAMAETEGITNGSSPKMPQHHLDHAPAPVTTTDSPYLHMATELRNLPGNSGANLAPVVGGVGGASATTGSLVDATSDRDSSSVHMDRSSTAAETLSRNTSMSSIVPEKSIDGDDILHDSEVESISGGVAGGGGGGGNGGGGGGGGSGGGLLVNLHSHNPEQDLNELPVSLSCSAQPPMVLTTSVGAISSLSVTTVVRHHDPAPLVTSSHSDIRKESE